MAESKIGHSEQSRHAAGISCPGVQHVDYNKWKITMDDPSRVICNHKIRDEADNFPFLFTSYFQLGMSA